MKVTQNPLVIEVPVSFTVTRAIALDVLGKYLSTYVNAFNYTAFCAELEADKEFFLEILQRALNDFGMTPTRQKRDNLGLDSQTWANLLIAIKAHIK